MSDTRIHKHGAQSGATVARKPRVVLVGPTTQHAEAAEQLRTLGWDVFTVPTVDDLVCTILARKPNAVVLPEETGTETGYLVAAKLRKAKPKLKVILVGQRTADGERFAKFVGGILVPGTDNLAMIVSELNQ